MKSIGQVAVIEDKDGFTNVRLEPNSKSEIIYQIKTDQVFWFGEDHYDKNSEWTSVYIPKNNFSFDCTSPDYLKGFVHKSRIRPFNEKEEYTGTELTFEYVIKPFSDKNKIIDYQESKWIVAINGLKPWGTDGGKPNTEIKEIKVNLNGKEIIVPKVLTIDIYECDNKFDIYKIGKTYFVHQWNSDGAGAYEIVWVITENGIKQRLVGTII